MIRRLAITTALGAAAAAALVAGAGSAAPTGSPHLALAAASSPLLADNDNHGPRPGPPGHDNRGPGGRPGPGHGPGWDGRGGPWDGRGGPGHGGGWDGNGGGWDGHRWWVSPERCRAGHGHVDRTRDRGHNFFCRGGRFNGTPVRP
jgi:hypothetical protein